MKNTMKKILVLCFAFVMLFGMATMASAATIKVTNAIEGKTYTAYKIFDVTKAGTDKYAYTIKKDSAWYGTVKTYAETASNKLTLTATPGDATTMNVTVGEGFSAANFAKALDAVKAEKPVKPVAGTAKGAASGETKIEVADAGYYFVDSTTGTLCALLTGDQEITAVEKNEIPPVDKRITKTPTIDEAGKKALAQVGEVVPYEATIGVKEGAKGYVFHDKMSAGLALEGNVVVTVDNATITASDDTFKLETNITDGDTIKITFNDTWIASQKNKTIKVSYSAKVTADAVTVITEKNTAKVSYGDGYSYDTEVVETNLYQATIKVNKVDGTTKTALADAEFILMRKTADNTEEYYKIDGTTPVVSWVANKAEATVRKTVIKDNVAVLDKDFIGLESGTYYLVETKAPAGYNLADAPVEVVIANSDAATDLTKTVEVTNNAGTILPSTGGIGTTIFYVIGCILVLGAGVILIARKRAQRM